MTQNCSHSVTNSDTSTPCLLAVLRMAGLRPTRQRITLAKLLFSGPHRHVCAESLHEEASKIGAKISLATVYNSLNQFVEVGLLREIHIDKNKSYFDTNTSDHHHFYVEDEQQVIDIPNDSVALENLPKAPDGMEITSVNVVMRVKKAKQPAN